MIPGLNTVLLEGPAGQGSPTVLGEKPGRAHNAAVLLPGLVT